MDRIRRECIRKTAQVDRFGDNVRGAEMVWTCAEEGQGMFMMGLK